MSAYPGDTFPALDPSSCSLLGPTALLVQGLMGILVLLSLLFKRQRERPKRKWAIWSFDVSKQVVGQLAVHLANVIISWVGARREDGNEGNACAWYVLNIMVDTTLGVMIIYGSLRLINGVLIDRLHLEGFTSGDYGEPPSWSFWFRQLFVYLFALAIMKSAVLGLFAIFPDLLEVGSWFLEWTEGNKPLQVVVVMGIVPIVMNILQFWLIDSIVKSKVLNFNPAPAPMPEDPSDREPLMPSHSSSPSSSPRIRPQKVLDDLEAQLPVRDGKDDLEEHKSLPGSVASGSNTRPVQERGESFRMAPLSRQSTYHHPKKRDSPPPRPAPPPPPSEPEADEANWEWNGDEWTASETGDDARMSTEGNAWEADKVPGIADGGRQAGLVSS